MLRIVELLLVRGSEHSLFLFYHRRIRHHRTKVKRKFSFKEGDEADLKCDKGKARKGSGDLATNYPTCISFRFRFSKYIATMMKMHF